MKHHYMSTARSKQQGLVLIIAMIFMLIVIILGLAGSSQSRVQMHIGSNAFSYQTALQSAEGALKQALGSMLQGVFDTADFSQQANGYYSYSTTTTPAWQQNLTSSSFWQSSSNAISAFQGQSSTTSSYVVEKMPNIVQSGQSLGNAGNYGQITTGAVYRVTARAVGPQGGSPVVLQAIFAK